VAGQIEAEELHLWQALRRMKERLSLIQKIGSHARNDGSELQADLKCPASQSKFRSFPPWRPNNAGHRLNIS